MKNTDDIILQLKEMIIDYKTMIRIESEHKNTREFDQKLIDAENEKTRKNAEIVYRHYLNDGESIAIERREMYLKRNLK